MPGKVLYLRVVSNKLNEKKVPLTERPSSVIHFVRLDLQSDVIQLFSIKYVNISIELPFEMLCFASTRKRIRQMNALLRICALKTELIKPCVLYYKYASCTFIV